MRLAIFMHRFSGKNWKLVLPPWPHLYHWKTTLINQDQLPWNRFFDLNSLKQFSPVIEMYEFFKENGAHLLTIDNVFVLQHYKDAFIQKNWNWNDKWSFESCNKDHDYEKSGNLIRSWFWGYSNISAKNMRCVSFQGGASLLIELLESTNDRFVMLDNAEVVLHDHFGNNEYWQCRQSMKFAEPLVQEAKRFMISVLNHSSVEENDIKNEKKGKRNAKGGSYLGVHLRRRDFIEGRPNEIPTLEYAAEQISDILLSQNLKIVFIATDAKYEEVLELKSLIQNYSLVQYSPDTNIVFKFKDGGIAIIDQIICSNARYFIGSYESTFSFRIQEEREILGFPEHTTFNRLCGAKKDCVQPSKWKIQY
ncbi:O-fucosyltransferase 2 isoform X2 [Rhodnius prolixus]